jgi:hypothetical protein
MDIELELTRSPANIAPMLKKGGKLYLANSDLSRAYVAVCASFGFCTLYCADEARVRL